MSNEMLMLIQMLQSGDIKVADEAVDETYLYELSSYLGHQIYPIKHVEIRDAGNNHFTFDMDAIQDYDSESSCYLRDDKYSFVSIPLSQLTNGSFEGKADKFINVYLTSDSYGYELYPQDMPFMKQVDEGTWLMYLIKVPNEWDSTEVILHIDYQEDR